MGKSAPGHVSKEVNSCPFLLSFFEASMAQHVITASNRSLENIACIWLASSS